MALTLLVGIVLIGAVVFISVSLYSIKKEKEEVERLFKEQNTIYN